MLLDSAYGPSFVSPIQSSKSRVYPRFVGQMNATATQQVRAVRSATILAAKEWKPWKLKYLTLSTILIFEAAILAAICVLLAISVRNYGFVTVEAQTSSPRAVLPTLSNFWTQGLLWTSLPTLLLTFFKIAYDAVVSAVVDRQPFVELARPKGTIAVKSILLDYRAYPILYSWIMALRNGHVLLSMVLFLSQLLGLVAVPLSSRLLSPKSVVQDGAVPLQLLTHYNDSAFNSRTDLKTIFDIVSATSVHGGSPPAWTSSEYAFNAFNFTDPKLLPANFTMNTIAYSAYLDCKPVEDFISSVVDNGDAHFSGTDRGCYISTRFSISSDISTYFHTFRTTNCTSATGYTRLGILSGMYSNSSASLLSNSSLVSCVSSYWRTPGPLTIIADSSLTSLRSPVLSFLPDTTSSNQTRTADWMVFETALHQPLTYDPTATILSTDLGRLIYARNLKANSNDPLSPDAIQDSASKIFTAVFAVLAGTVLFQPSSTPSITDGTMSINVTRLFVVEVLAYILIVICSLVILTTIYITLITSRRKSILREEPRGIFGYASLAHTSSLTALFQEAHSQRDFDGTVLRKLNKSYDVGNSKCNVDNVDALSPRIQFEGKKRL